MTEGLSWEKLDSALGELGPSRDRSVGGKEWAF